MRRCGGWPTRPVCENRGQNPHPPSRRTRRKDGAPAIPFFMLHRAHPSKTARGWPARPVFEDRGQNLHPPSHRNAKEGWGTRGGSPTSPGPGGTADNSPPVHWREAPANAHRVPEGRLKTDLHPPWGWWRVSALPGVETPGYFPPSLRDLIPFVWGSPGAYAPGYHMPPLRGWGVGVSCGRVAHTTGLRESGSTSPPSFAQDAKEGWGTRDSVLHAASCPPFENREGRVAHTTGLRESGSNSPPSFAQNAKEGWGTRAAAITAILAGAPSLSLRALQGQGGDFDSDRSQSRNLHNQMFTDHRPRVRSRSTVALCRGDSSASSGRDVCIS